MAPSLMTLSIMVECCYAECHLCFVLIVLTVANKHIVLNVIMLSVMAPVEQSIPFKMPLRYLLDQVIISLRCLKDHHLSMTGHLILHCQHN
jgi:hypothetical protein